MYSITVTDIGVDVPALLEERMLVLFGPTVPAELRDLCVVHDGLPTQYETLYVGGNVSFASQEYRIVEIGEVANTNFGGLGHLTVIFKDSGELLPGCVRVTPDTVPSLSIGDTVTFETRVPLSSHVYMR